MLAYLRLMSLLFHLKKLKCIKFKESIDCAIYVFQRRMLQKLNFLLFTSYEMDFYILNRDGCDGVIAE